ncbi:serine hydrolase domain-containing protein [Methylobacterium oryzihabitans]|nr:serine hydrolase [Methylobacterium oryzihabitans]
MARSRIGRYLRHWLMPLVLAAGPPAAAQDGGTWRSTPAAAMSDRDADALRPVVDRLVGQAVTAEAIPGVIVGVSWQGRRSYFGYAATGGQPFGSDTIVEVGSITKVFTTALFAQALREGRMQAEAPLRSLMPERRLSACTGRITPLQLADFQSGMPELPPDVPRDLAQRGIDTYTARDFLDWVARWPGGGDGDDCALPAPYRYSNASIGLLGILVAERLGAPWADLVHSRITAPLGMGSTAIRVPEEQRDRLAQGHGPGGRPVMPWPVFAWYAAGALRSTAADMLAFGEAALGHPTVNGAPVPPALTQAFRDAMAPIYRPEGQSFAQAMAWQVETGDPEAGQHPVFMKAGGTDGFNSVIAVNPSKDLAIFIGASRAQSGIPRLGVMLARQIRGEALR